MSIISNEPGAVEITDPETPAGPEASDDEEFLLEARARFALAEEAETEIRRLALEDLEFRAGNQWPDQIKMERDEEQRPCLVINRLPQFIQQVTNDQRQNRPSIRVHPVGDGADEDTADIFKGIIRHVEYNSNAECAYDTAFESAATGGFGYFRIVTDFVDPESFDQEILIKRIRDPFSVFFDPYSSEPDGSDAEWAFIVTDLSPDKYRSDYPDSDLASIGDDWSSIGNQVPGWVKSDSARVAEYFYKEWVEETIHLLATGETVKDADLASRQMAAAGANLDARVMKTRVTKVPVVKWCKLNGLEILERTEWLGVHIPIIPVYGAEIFIDGKRILESVIRNAKDSQRMYNYWASAETETIALAPKTPYIIAEGQVEGYEVMWGEANRKNLAFLPYKATSVAGSQVPPPQRQSIEANTQAITQARSLAADDMKATTGIFDPSLGDQSNEVSGVAIQRRNNQSQTGNFHFVDNLTRSLRHAGRILVDLIPKIYDTARTARIVKEDGTQDMVRVNDPTNKDKAGQSAIYTLDTGRYDVTIDVGPSYASKRQEAAESMIEFTRALPETGKFVADLIAKNMDWPGSQDFADRIRKTLPPGLADDPKAQQIPPQVQAHMQQMQTMIQQLVQHLNEKTQVIEQKSIERDMLQMELSSKQEIEAMRLRTQSEIALGKLGSESSIALLGHQVAELMQREKLNAQAELHAAKADARADDTSLGSSQSDGGSSADFGPRGPNPTGGQSPGSTMEGNP